MLGPEKRGLIFVRSPMIMKGYSSENHGGKVRKEGKLSKFINFSNALLYISCSRTEA
jgi:hypothetical protein